MDQPHSRVELSILGERLVNKDFLGKSDPVCVVKIQTEPEQWREIGRTEMVSNDLNPIFNRTFVLDYFCEQPQFLEFELWDIDQRVYAGRPDPSIDDFLGTVQCYLSEIVGGQENTLRREISLPGKRRAGWLVVRAQELDPDCCDAFRITFRGERLKKMDLFGKSDPFFVISKKMADESWQQVYRSEVLKYTLNPTWTAARFTIQRLGGSYDHPCKFDCYDWNRFTKPSYIGSFEFTLNDLKRETRFQLSCAARPRDLRRGHILHVMQIEQRSRNEAPRTRAKPERSSGMEPKPHPAVAEPLQPLPSGPIPVPVSKPAAPPYNFVTDENKPSTGHELIADCIGVSMEFISSSRTFFAVLSVSQSVYDFFHSYGSSFCSNVVFDLLSNDPDLVRMEAFLEKPYLRIMRIKNRERDKGVLGRFFCVLSFLPNLQELVIEVPRGAFDLEWLLRLPNPGNLRELTFGFDFYISSLSAGTQNFTKILPVMTSLTALRLQLNGLESLFPRGRVDLRLKTLRLGTLGLVNPSIAHLFNSSMLSLEALSVKFCRKAMPLVFLPKEILSNLANLVDLKLDGDKMTTETTREVLECVPVSVRRLWLSTNRRSAILTRDTMDILRVRNVRIEGFVFEGYKVQPDFLLPVSEWITCLSFEYLFAENCRGEERASILLDAHDFPRLRRMFVFTIDIHLTGRFEELRTLSLSMAFPIMDRTIRRQKPAFTSPSLNSLHLVFSKKYPTEFVVPGVSSGRLGLETIVLSSVSINDFLQVLDPLVVTKLCLNDWSSRPSIRDDAIAHFVNVEYLLLRNFPQVKCEFFPSLARLREFAYSIPRDCRPLPLSLEIFPFGIEKIALENVDVGTRILMTQYPHLRCFELMTPIRRGGDNRIPQVIQSISFPTCERVLMYGHDLKGLEISPSLFSPRLNSLGLDDHALTKDQKDAIKEWFPKATFPYAKCWHVFRSFDFDANPDDPRRYQF